MIKINTGDISIKTKLLPEYISIYKYLPKYERKKKWTQFKRNIKYQFKY